MQRTLLRTLGLSTAISITICAIVGQGVFLKARVMTCEVNAPALMLGAWVIAGVLALCGALTLAELGAAIPETGGIYAFLRRAYGGAMAFAYGWMVLFIGAPASIATLAVGAAIFFDLWSGHALARFALGVQLTAGTHLALSGIQSAAVFLIAVVAAVNCAPAVVNGRAAAVFAGLKIAMLAGITFAAFGLGHGAPAHFSASAGAGTCSDVAASLRGGLPGFAAALIGALFAYNGWNALNFVAGEVKNPGRTIPLALGASVALVILLYTAANAAFVYVLGPVAIASLPPNTSVAVVAVEKLLGPAWRFVAAGLLFLSVAATLHVTMLTLARVTFALSQGGLAFGALGRVSRHGRVPVNAVLANAALASVLVLLGSFETLSNYFIFNLWVFYVAAGLAMFVLRRREPLLPRPYRTIGYPLVPAAFVALGGWLVVETLITQPGPSLVGVAIIAVSFPVYFLRRRAGR